MNSIYGRNKFGSVYLKREGKDYKERMIEYIKKEAKKQGWSKVMGKFLYMDEVIYMNQKGRDPDNLKKLQQDCITESGVVWEDDSWCLPRTNRVFIDKFNPRIEIVITPCDFIGIFDDNVCLQKFKRQCVECRRYKNNCSILRQALESRIQPEIVDFECSEFKQIAK